MKQLYFVFLTALALAANSTNLLATNYYVDQDHPNAINAPPSSGGGTATQPWKTLTYAAGIAAAGDTVYIIKSATPYLERSTAGPDTIYVKVKNAGTKANPIKFIGVGRPVFENVAIHIDTSHVHVSFLTLREVGCTLGTTTVQGVQVATCATQSSNPSPAFKVNSKWGPVTYPNGKAQADFISETHGVKITDNHIAVTYTSAIDVEGVPTWGVNPWHCPAGGNSCAEEDKVYHSVRDITIQRNTISHATIEGFNEQITLAHGVKDCKITDNYQEYGGNHNGDGSGEGIDLKEGVLSCMIANNILLHLVRTAIYLDGGRSGQHGVSGTPPGMNNYPLEPVKDVWIFNNFISGVQLDGNGIQVSTEGRGNVEDVYIMNNLIVKNPNMAISLLLYRDPSNGEATGQAKNINYINNTVSENTMTASQAWNTVEINWSGAENITVGNNIVYGNAGTPVAIRGGNYSNLLNVNNLTSNPMFRNPSAWDYRLAPGSPAIDAVNSVVLPAPPFDFLGVLRPQGLESDLGALEFY